MKITQFGLCFSPNLGDGVIAECLAHGLRARHPGVEVSHIDLSGRQAFGAVTIRNREAILAVLDRLPGFVRQRLALWKLNRVVDGVEESWRAAAECDLAVIGGGQILSDANLNFPIKVSRAARLLAETRAPTALYAVGVSRNWSRRGTDLFRDLLETDLRLVGPRDGPSAAALSDQIGGGPAAEIIADPGLLAADCYGAVTAMPGLVGVCVTDFGLLGHHADGTVAGAATGGVRFYVDLVGALAAQGHRVLLFSNGAAEDQALRRAVLEALEGTPQAASLEISPDPARPAELVSQIARCSAVVAHRLHACIVAYSYGRPVVGLGWDRKLQSFFEAVGMAESFTGDPNAGAADIAALVDAGLARGVAAPDHAAAVGRAWAGIDRLLACVTPPSEG